MILSESQRERFGKHEYKRLTPHVVTSFHLAAASIKRSVDRVADRKRMRELLVSMPFSCIRIVAPALPYGSVRIQSEAIIECARVEGSQFEGSWAMQSRTEDGGQVCVSYRSDPNEFPWSELEGLLSLLRDSRNRYIEKPMSRQVKRAMGVNVPDYHEYIIIDRRDVKEGDKAQRWSDIARRHPYLHAVRSHLRRLECGRIVQVRAHTRGKGTLFQVKDYRVEGASAQ